MYAGDSGFFSIESGVAEREAAAAARLVEMLPESDRRRLGHLIREFQEQSTLEARYARALDALQPMILVAWYPEGTGIHWSDSTRSIRLARKLPLLKPFPVLEALAIRLTDLAVERGVISGA